MTVVFESFSILRLLDGILAAVVLMVLRGVSVETVFIIIDDDDEDDDDDDVDSDNDDDDVDHFIRTTTLLYT